MMSAHIIEELCFDVDFGSEDEAFDAQERLMRFAQGRAQQVIAEVFDEAIEPDAILRLEKLQVDIGTLNAVDFEDRFAERLRDELRTLLRDRRAEVGQSEKLGRSESPGLFAGRGLSVDLKLAPAEPRALELLSHAPEPGDHSAESASPSVGHLTTGARAEIDWLLHFIEYGYLPWHAPAHIGRDMHALAARVLERNGTQLARALRAAPVSHRRAIFRRLVAQFPAEWLAGLGRQIGLAKRQSLVAPAGEAIAPAITPGGIGIDVAQDHAAYTATHAAYSRANSEPAEVVAVSHRASAESEIPRATRTVVPGDLHEVLARSRFRAQIEALLSESPESDFALVTSMPVSPDTWRSVLRDDAPWLKSTLLHLGRGIRVRRRLAAVLPKEVVPGLIALWFSPTQVDRVLAAIGATAPFTRELPNTDVSRDAISATGLLDTLTYILVDGGATEFSESGYRRSLANQTARHADEAVDRGGISSGSIPALQSNAEPGDKTRDLPPSPAAARVLVGTARVGSLESRTTVGKNPAAHPATDATAQSLALSDSPAAADQDARPDVQRLPDAGTTSDARPSTAARSDADLTAPATPAFAARAAVHSKTLLQVNPVVPAAAHFQAHSEPAEVAAVSLRASADSEIRRATHTVVPDDLHEALARSRFRSRAQIEAALSESPESDFAPVTSIAVSPDTWRSVLRDDAPWLKTTLLHLGRGIRVRRRLAAVLPEEIVPDLLALWFSPTQVDAVLATIGASAALFTGEPSNPDIPRDALSPAGLLATLTYILVEGGAWEFSESGYWRSLANQTARVGDEALDRDRTAAGPIPGPRSSADPSPQNDRHDDLEHLAHPLSEGRATPLTPTRRSPAEKKQPTVAEVRGAEPPPPSPRTRRDTAYASSVENRTIAAANLADPPATDAAARAFGLSNSSAAADQGARPDIPLLPEAAAISDARPETSTAARSDTNPTAPVTTRDPAVRPAAHFETPAEVNLALPAAMHFQAGSEPAEVTGVGLRTPTGPERLRATNTLGPGEPREALANLRAHAQSLDGRATQLTESSGSPVAKQSATADHLTKDSGSPVARESAIADHLTRGSSSPVAKQSATADHLTRGSGSPVATESATAEHLTKGSGSPVARESATADHLTRGSGSPVARESATAEHLTKGSGSPVATESATAEHLTRGSGSPVATESATAELSHQPLDIAVAQNGHYVPSPTMVKSRDDTERDIPSLRDTHTDTDTGAKQPAQITLGAHSPGAPSPTAANSRAVTSNEACQATFTTALPKPPPATHEPPPLTELPDSTPGVTLAASGTSPAPYDADLLRHLRGALTANSPTNVLRRALRTVLDQRSAAARRALLSALEYPGAAHRLAALLTVDDLPDVLQWLRPTDGAMALAIAARVIRLGQSAGDHITPRQDEARGSSSPASDGADREKNNDTGTDVVTRVASEFLLTELFEEGRTLDPEPFAQRLTAALGAALAPQAQSESTIAERTHSSDIARSSTRPAADLPPKNAVTMAEDDAITQRIYIANAGIVIVGPYLPRLFSMLELTNKGSFTTLSSAYRAVHLIQYIVTQSTVTPEPMLVLNKILCGLPVSAPIPLEIDLRAQEQAAIEDMLTAIIAHWKAIGRTSIAGLRESFLQREGRLVFTDDAWRLRVESKSFDMLIDRLPWGYTMVKYPWMKRVLHVDWR